MPSTTSMASCGRSSPSTPPDVHPTARRRLGLAVALVLGALVGCTGDDDTSTTTLVPPAVTTPPPIGPTTSVAPPDLTAAYFDALAGGRAVPETVAVPGSDADAYARFLRVASGVIATDAAPIAAATASSVPAGVDVCDPDCTTYSLVAADPATGRIETFAIDGVPLAGRVVGDGLRADDDGVIARVDTAFRNRDGDVLVVVEVRNTTDVGVELFGFSSVYVPSGSSSSREASGWWGAEAFDAGMGGSVLLAFAEPDGTAEPTAGLPLGSGRLSLSGLRADGVAVALDLTLPRAAG